MSLMFAFPRSGGVRVYLLDGFGGSGGGEGVFTDIVCIMCLLACLPCVAAISHSILVAVRHQRFRV